MKSGMWTASLQFYIFFMIQENQQLFVSISNSRSKINEICVKNTSCELVKTILYSSADEFLKDISYGGAMYSILNRSLVFRGLQTGIYNLVPSILRKDCKRINDANNDFAESEELQRTKEYLNLRYFFELCDLNRLRLPNVERIRMSLYSHKDIGEAKLLLDDWLPTDLYELAALAQHYGMETRLLDWTSNLETAIYFAVHQEPLLSEEDQKNNDAKYLVIWALDTSIESKVSSLKFIRPPYYGNPNLAAQKGLFSCWVEPGFKIRSNVITEEEHRLIMSVKVNRKPLDQRLEEELKEKQLDKPYMWKLMIPCEGRKVLYEYIDCKGINAASLFPGYGGIVKCIKEASSLFLC